MRKSAANRPSALALASTGKCYAICAGCQKGVSSNGGKRVLASEIRACAKNMCENTQKISRISPHRNVHNAVHHVARLRDQQQLPQKFERPVKRYCKESQHTVEHQSMR